MMRALSRRLFKILHRWPSEKAIIAACIIGLLALAIIVGGMLFNLIPIVVVGGMALGPGALAVSILLYAMSVAAEYLRDTHAPVAAPDTSAEPAKS